MAAKIPIVDEAVALAAMTRLLQGQYDDGDESDRAAFLVDSAARVQFRPSTRQLVLTFDLAMGEQAD